MKIQSCKVSGFLVTDVFKPYEWVNPQSGEKRHFCTVKLDNDRFGCALTANVDCDKFGLPGIGEVFDCYIRSKAYMKDGKIENYLDLEIVGLTRL